MMDNIGKKTFAATTAVIILTAGIAGVGILTNWFGVGEKTGYGNVIIDVAGAGGFGDNTRIYQVDVYMEWNDGTSSEITWSEGDSPLSYQVEAGENIYKLYPVVGISTDYASDTNDAESNTRITNTKIENQTSTLYTASAADYSTVSVNEMGTPTSWYAVNYQDTFANITVDEGENITISFTYEIYA